MAKRFIDTSFYKSPFVRGLKGSMKALYTFIICDCTGDGIWTLDLDIASIYTGFNYTKKEFEDAFVKTGKAIDLLNGRYFFADFIEHQYPSGLSLTNVAHKNFITELNKYGLLDATLKPLKRPFDGSKVMVMVKGNGIGDGKGNTEPETPKKEEPEKDEIIWPFDSEEFKNHWGLWVRFKKEQFKFTYKSDLSLQGALKELAELSGGIEETAIKIINQSINKGWQGFFALKTGVKTDSNTTQTNKFAANDAAAQEILIKLQNEGNHD